MNRSYGGRKGEIQPTPFVLSLLRGRLQKSGARWKRAVPGKRQPRSAAAQEPDGREFAKETM
jgi:hypothetical protein